MAAKKAKTVAELENNLFESAQTLLKQRGFEVTDVEINYRMCFDGDEFTFSPAGDGDILVTADCGTRILIENHEAIEAATLLLKLAKEG